MFYTEERGVAAQSEHSLLCSWWLIGFDPWPPILSNMTTGCKMTKLAVGKAQNTWELLSSPTLRWLINSVNRELYKTFVLCYILHHITLKSQFREALKPNREGFYLRKNAEKWNLITALRWYREGTQGEKERGQKREDVLVEWRKKLSLGAWRKQEKNINEEVKKIEVDNEECENLCVYWGTSREVLTGCDDRSAQNSRGFICTNKRATMFQPLLLHCCKTDLGSAINLP